MCGRRCLPANTNPASRIPHHASRHGFNLVELLFAVSAISALAVLAMTVVGLLITAEQHSAEALWVDVTIANLAADLREDAHRATSIETTPDEDGRASQITLTQPDDVRVTYECTADSVVCRRQVHDKVQATETYRLAFGSSWFEPQAGGGLVTWTHSREIPSIGGFSQPTPAEAAPQRTYQITAVLNLHAAIAGKDGQ